MNDNQFRKPKIQKIINIDKPSVLMQKILSCVNEAIKSNIGPSIQNKIHKLEAILPMRKKVLKFEEQCLLEKPPKNID